MGWFFGIRCLGRSTEMAQIKTALESHARRDGESWIYWKRRSYKLNVSVPRYSSVGAGNSVAGLNRVEVNIEALLVLLVYDIEARGKEWYAVSCFFVELLASWSMAQSIRESGPLYCRFIRRSRAAREEEVGQSSTEIFRESTIVAHPEAGWFVWRCEAWKLSCAG